MQKVHNLRCTYTANITNLFKTHFHFVGKRKAPVDGIVGSVYIEAVEDLSFSPKKIFLLLWQKWPLINF